MIHSTAHTSYEKGPVRNAMVISAVSHVAVILWSMAPMAIGPDGETVYVIESRLSDPTSLPELIEDNVSTGFEQLLEISSNDPLPDNNRDIPIVTGATGIGEPRSIPFPDDLITKSSPGKASPSEPVVTQHSKASHRPTGNAVTKGSFTVWTSPEFPAIRQNYWVFIAVSLPKKTTASGKPRVFPVSDVTGRVRGSDSYTQSLLFDQRFPGVVEFLDSTGVFVKAKKTTRIPISAKGIQLRVLVAGAELPKTVDMVNLRSRILRETQEITLRFKPRPTRKNARNRQGAIQQRR